MEMLFVRRNNFGIYMRLGKVYSKLGILKNPMNLLRMDRHNRSIRISYGEVNPKAIQSAVYDAERKKAEGSLNWHKQTINR